MGTARPACFDSAVKATSPLAPKTPEHPVQYPSRGRRAIQAAPSFPVAQDKRNTKRNTKRTRKKKDKRLLLLSSWPLGSPARRPNGHERAAAGPARDVLGVGSLVSRTTAGIAVGEPGQALLAGVVEADGLPDLAFGAGLLDEAGGLTEAGKGEGVVLAREGVGVVLAHVWTRAGRRWRARRLEATLWWDVM